MRDSPHEKDRPDEFLWCGDVAEEKADSSGAVFIATGYPAPWSDLPALIVPHYATSGRRGRQPIELEVILRIHLVQLAYNYSLNRH